jgi:xanthine dehydrogenase accessory factor
MTDEELARLAAPIGLDLGALTSEETALSIMAEVVAVRHGRGGGQLSAAGAARIHEVGA